MLVEDWSPQQIAAGCACYIPTGGQVLPASVADP